MSGLAIACPHCGLTGRADYQRGDGSKVRCPRCLFVFRGDDARTLSADEPPVDDAPKFEVRTPPKPTSAHGSLHGVRIEKPPANGMPHEFSPWPWVAFMVVVVAMLFGLIGGPNAIGPAIMLGLLILPFAIMGAIGIYIADQKGRPTKEGFWFGFFLGPIGWIIVALLPTIPDSIPQRVGPGEP